MLSCGQLLFYFQILSKHLPTINTYQSLPTSLHGKELALRQLNEQVSTLQQSVSNERTRNAQQDDLNKRLKRKLLLVTKVGRIYTYHVGMHSGLKRR